MWVMVLRSACDGGVVMVEINDAVVVFVLTVGCVVMDHRFF